MTTREQNFKTIEDLQSIMGYDSVGNDLLLQEVLLWIDLPTKVSMYEDICNLWDVDKIEDLSQKDLLNEVVKYFTSDYMQSILDDIKNLWV